jgi:hypothetical protein
MTVSRRPFQENQQTEIGTYSFEIVEEFMYLGTSLTSKNETRPEIEKRMATANKSILRTSSHIEEPVCI